MNTLNDKTYEKFLLLWEKYHADIQKLCRYKLCAYPERQEDCVQDVFLVLYKYLSQGNEILNPKAWLLKTTNNLIKKQYAQINYEKKHVQQLNGIPYETNCVSHDFLEIVITDSMIEQYANEIVSRLSEDDRILLEKLYRKNLPLNQIANDFDVANNTLYQRIFRVRVKVKKMIKEYIEGN